MKLKGYIYSIISALFFGMAGILVKNGTNSVFTPVDLLMLQYIMAEVILFFICLIGCPKGFKISNNMFIKLFIQGALFNTLMTVFFYTSFKYLDVAIATMLLYTYPVMVAVSSLVFFKEKISRTKITAIIGTTIGCLLVLNIAGGKMAISTSGTIYGLLAAVFYTLMNLYAKYIVDEVPAPVITFYTTTFSLLVLFIFNFGFFSKLSYVNYEILKSSFLLSLMCEIIPLTLLYAAIKYVGPVTTSIISTLELPSSAVLSFIFLGENLNLLQIGGIILVVYCIIILKRS